MLRSLRKAAGGWTAKILLFFLVISFAVWGINDIFTGYHGDAVVRVGESEVSGEELRIAIQQEMQRVSQQIGRPLTVQEAQAFGIHGQVVGHMVTELLLDEKARLAGITVSDEAVRQSIIEDPNFQSAGGRFDRGMFEQYLRFSGLTEPLFVERQRQFLARQIVGESVGGGGRVPETLRDALAQHQTDVRLARYFRIKPEALPPLALPSEEDLRTYFEANTSRFDAPEYRRVGVIALTPETVASTIEITSDDARAYYDSRINRYTVAEKRRIRQIIFSDPESAAAARAKITAGAKFEDIMTAQGITTEEASLGLVTKGQLVDPAVADAAFALEQGSVSAPVDGQFGTALLIVDEIIPATVTSFEAAEPGIRRELAEARAKEAILDLHDEIEDSRASGATLEEIAAKKHLNYVVMDAVDRTGQSRDGDLGVDKVIVDQIVGDIFKSDIGLENDPVQIRGGDFVWYEVLDIIPTRTRTFDEAREAVAKAWTSAQETDRLDHVAKEAVDAISGGSDISEVAKPYGAPVIDTEPLRRSESATGFGAAAVRTLFGGPVDTVAWSVGDGDDERIIMVRRSAEANASQIEQARESVEARLQGGLANDLLVTYVSGLESEFDVVVNSELLSQSLGLPTSNY